MSHILQLTILRYPEIEGGVDTMVASIVTHLKQRHKVSVFVPGGWDQKTLSRRSAEGVPIYSIRLRMPFGHRHSVTAFLGWLIEFPRTLLTLRSLAREQGIDIIHAHMGKDYHLYLRVLRWLGGPPYVITLHRAEVADFHSLSSSSQWLMKFALRGAARINAVARWLALDAERIFPGIGPITWVHNGFTLPDRSLVAPPIATHFAESLPQRYAIMVGAFDPYKGHETAFRAWQLLPESLRDLELLVVGDGALRPHYEAVIVQLGCGQRIRLVGQIPHHDVLRLMRGALTMVLPSRSEGFAYALLEAGAVGIPVVCSQIPAFLEVIANGVNGLVIPVDDHAALAAAVECLAGDAALRERLGSNLQQQIHSHFTVEAMTDAYERLYAEVLGGTRRPRNPAQTER